MKLIKRFTVAVLLSLSLVIPAMSADLKIIYSYDKEQTVEVASYNLYQDGMLFCNATSATEGEMFCSGSLDYSEHTYTLTAVGVNGVESSKSPEYLFSLEAPGVRSRLSASDVWSQGQSVHTDPRVPDVTGGRIGSLGECSGALTYAEATAWAESQGARLPSYAESILGEGTGCNYNGQMIWTTEQRTEGTRVVRGGDTYNNDKEDIIAETDTAYVTMVADAIGLEEAMAIPVIITIGIVK